MTGCHDRVAWLVLVAVGLAAGGCDDAATGPVPVPDGGVVVDMSPLDAGPIDRRDAGCPDMGPEADAASDAAFDPDTAADPDGGAPDAAADPDGGAPDAAADMAPPDIPCGDDDDCPPTRFCDRDGPGVWLCQRGCRVDGCPDDRLCDPASRACVDRCRFDADCPDGAGCDGRLCTPLPCRVPFGDDCLDARRDRCPVVAEYIERGRCVDADGDCFVAGCVVPLALVDCDDRRADINPLAREACDDIDHDCDGDALGRFALGAPCEACGWAGVTECAVDDPYRSACSTRAGQTDAVRPMERCDGGDDDCDGRVDERCVYLDAPGGELDGLTDCGDRGLVVVRDGGLELWGGSDHIAAPAAIRPPGSGVRHPRCGDGGIAWLEVDAPCVDGAPRTCPGVVWAWRDGDPEPAPVSAPGDVGPPAMYGDTVIWHTLSGGRPVLLARGRGEEVPRALIASPAGDPSAVSDGHLAFRVPAEPSPLVALLDVERGERRTIEQPLGDTGAGRPTLSPTWVAWSAAAERQQSFVWVVPVAGRDGFRPVPRPGLQSAPRLEGDRLAWLEGEPAEVRELRLMDLTTGVEQVVARGVFGDDDFDIGAGGLWWVEAYEAGTSVRRHAFGDPEGPLVGEQRCARVSDEDGDGLIGCADPDCAGVDGCLVDADDCGALGDEDGDGLADCADPDCADSPLCALFEVPAPGAALTLRGALGPDDRRWLRPDAACVARQGAPDVYDAIRLHNPGDEPATARVTAAFEGGGGALFAFVDPLAPDACLAAHDPTLGPERRLEVDFAPRQVRVVALSTFAGADDEGPYALEVVTLPPTVDVPEPGAEAPYASVIGDGAPTWRPPDACEGEGALDQRYAIVELRNGFDVDVGVTVHVERPAGLHAYAGGAPLDPAERDRCLAADDPNGDPLAGRLEVGVPGGGGALLVVSDGGAGGEYTLRVTR